MTKKIITTSVVMGAMFTLIGCGGGSDSESTPAIGTAFYIDSAVSGVNYTCGAQEGITGADGSFTFEVGASCTFYLGDIELRGVDAELLVDGESVYETNVKIARILQSLDSDGNPDNGITIDPVTVQALADEGITSLPTTGAEMDEMLQVIEDNGGTYVSEDDAQAHLDQVEEEAIAEGTIPAPSATLEQAVVGRTIFGACEDGYVEEMLFGTDGVIHGIGSMGGVEGTETFEMNYRIDGDVLYTVEPEDGEEDAHKFSGAGSTSVSFLETGGDTTTFYYSRADAIANPQAECGGEDEDGGSFEGITESMLTGKTFYEAFPDGNDVQCYAKMTLSLSEGGTRHEICYNADDSLRSDETFTFDVALVDGKIEVVNGEKRFKLISESSSAWQVIDELDNDGTETWYLSKPSGFPDSL